MILRCPKNVPRWSQDGPNMAQDVCLRLSSAFILGLLGRSLDLPSFCPRFAFAPPSLCLRFAFVLPLLCPRFTFALPSLCFRIAFALPSLFLSNGGAPLSQLPNKSRQRGTDDSKRSGEAFVLLLACNQLAFGWLLACFQLAFSLLLACVSLLLACLQLALKLLVASLQLAFRQFLT